jgi:hypothetical protein
MLFAQKNEDFDQIYLNTGSKCGKLSLDLIFYNNFPPPLPISFAIFMMVPAQF